MKMFKKKEASPPKEKKKRMTKERAVRLLSSALVIAMVAGLFFGNTSQAAASVKTSGYFYFQIYHEGVKTSDVKICFSSSHTKKWLLGATWGEGTGGSTTSKQSSTWSMSIEGENHDGISVPATVKTQLTQPQDSNATKYYKRLDFTITYQRKPLYAHNGDKTITHVSGNDEALDIEGVNNGVRSNTDTITESATIKINGSQAGIFDTDGMPAGHGTIAIGFNREGRKLTFDENGGSDVSNIECLYGDSKNLPVPSRQGYRFDGWLRDDGGLWNEIDNGEVKYGQVFNNRSFTAQWTKMSKTFKFHTNGGTAVSDQTLNDPGSISAPETTRSGNYVFKGWSENADGSGTKILAGQDLTYTGWSDWGEVNLYAVWERKGANWNMENVVEDEDMFTNDEALEGEAGTTYDEEYTNSEYAHKDSADDPGYFSGK